MLHSSALSYKVVSIYVFTHVICLWLISSVGKIRLGVSCALKSGNATRIPSFCCTSPRTIIFVLDR